MNYSVLHSLSPKMFLPLMSQKIASHTHRHHISVKTDLMQLQFFLLNRLVFGKMYRCIIHKISCSLLFTGISEWFMEINAVKDIFHTKCWGMLSFQQHVLYITYGGKRPNRIKTIQPFLADKLLFKCVLSIVPIIIIWFQQKTLKTRNLFDCSLPRISSLHCGSLYV